MDHYQIEKEIQHLEQIINRISANDPLPMSYWRKRVKDLVNVTIIPAQRERARRLGDALDVVEARWNKAAAP